MPSIATYHKRKLYVPKEVEEKLGLVDGDKAEIQVVDEKSFTVSLKRKSSPEDRIVERILHSPFTSKIRGKSFKREDYYDAGRS
jgi:bifunctional DNA-binding transcriptional regulator/antitoxin component of YhaV-PrlF toxin-antitoxin module